MAHATHAALKSQADRLKLEVDSLRTQQGSQLINIGDYILKRLEQLGVTAMFGLPGDFNLGFLDLVEDNPNIEWIGNCNELNSAYAADGYARVKETSLGVLLTTYGVGELSAFNGIAGCKHSLMLPSLAYAEMIPVLHLVGAPSTTQAATRPMLHHTLGDGRFDAYGKAFEQVTTYWGDIINKDTAAFVIDRSITECIVKARPAYLTLPTNMVFEKIPADRLSIPLSALTAPNDPETEAQVIEEIVKHFEEADGEVVVLIDACAVRHYTRREVNDFVRAMGLPVYSTPQGKTVIDEQYARYGGIYVGALSQPQIRQHVDNARLVLNVGGLRSDYNTGNFTYGMPTARTIELHSDHTQIGHAIFQNVGMKELIPKLTPRLLHFAPKASRLPVPKWELSVPREATQDISQAWFWPIVGEKILKNGDVVIAETGTAAFGMLSVPFPANTTYVSQLLWGSIGYSVGAALGCQLAARDRAAAGVPTSTGAPVPSGRTILFVGDGSMQLTAQEVSSMIRWQHTLKEDTVIFLLNNDGYTIERFIHGRHRRYNSIQRWDWGSLLRTFGDPKEERTKSYRAATKSELLELLAGPIAKGHGGKIVLVEVIMDKDDGPQILADQAQLSAKANAYEPTV
ncbi:pyruvate decarboxylase [Fistulina hepatica ATCC 64428]|uniref:Pyruvate decarboxylase n=1 Tax=Fistulina hepatica ATCC 64428 TaxID=1128425 RepID=A0A0D7A9A3_9AGAR|nr:pyruvate decarboxylase [Fistulina hepatica ATCC 64428]